MKPIYIFYHVAAMNHWEQVVTEQVDLLRSSRLWEESRWTDATILGSTSPKFWFRENFNHIYRSPDILKFEFPTLSRIWHMAQTEEFYGLYIHTKGVRTGCQGSIADWRRMMGHFLVSRWRDAVKKLDEGYDCVGCEPGRMPWNPPRDFFHYSGNFWWARSDFIRRLPPIEGLDLNHRELAEAWLGMAGDPNYYVAYRSGIDHNTTLLPMSAYVRKGYE